MKKTKRSFRWAFGYIFIRLIFFSWVAIALFWWYNISWTELWIMTLWISIAIIALIIMVILHIVIFRMSDKVREKWIKILRIIWKIIWITLLVALILLIINIIYGKIQYSKIPEVDESMFYRTEHQTKLPEEEDALIQLKKLDNNLNDNELFKNIESIYYSIRNSNSNLYKNSKNWREWHQDECIIVYSGDQVSCWTRVRNKDTLDRILSTYNDELSIDWEKVTIMEYLDAKEPEIKAELEKLDNIVSMDYYLPNDQLLSILPSWLQKYTQSSIVLMLYYTEKENWEMVDYLIKLNYKNIDILNNLWSVIATLISAVMQDNIDNTINSIMQLFPEDFRLNLAEWYTENMQEKEDIIHKMAKWEYIIWNEQLEIYPVSFWEVESMIFYFPLYSPKDTKKLMLYGYSLLYNEQTDEINNLVDNTPKILWKSIYNILGKQLFIALMPRVSWISARINRNLFHKQALITNLKSWKYDVRFNEKQRNDNPSNYEIYRLPTEE